VSKKEIRRAARDAFPKAKNASAARRRGSSGAYGKRTRTASTASAPGRAVPRPPSIRRSLIFGVVAAVLYFVFIQWLLPKFFAVGSPSLTSNILVAVMGLLLFVGANYLAERYRYRRYLSKQKGSSK
jgi:hypothetical protein